MINPSAILTLVFLFQSTSAVVDPEVTMTSIEIIRYWGYPAEEHDVITADGYILTMFRIRHGRFSETNSSCNRPAVLFAHGLGGTAGEFYMNPPESSPAFILADAGFDVFLLNHRGSRFSKRHATLSTSYKTFWQFSLDELAKYDAPAVIDKVLQLSGQHGTYWIGHSQGTSVGYMMLAENPEYNSKVKGLFQLAPAGSSGYLKGPLTLLQWYYAAFKEILDFVRFAEGARETIRSPLHNVCDAVTFAPKLCAVAVQILAGPSAQPLNVTRLPVYLAQAIFATSTWNVAQWAQMGFHRRIEHMDHTPVENMRRYGQITPPPYNYSGITVPIYHFWSRNDLLTTPEDTERTILPILRKGAVKGSIEVPEYNHIDFALATDCAEKVFRPIEKIVRKQETQMCLR